MSIKSTCKNLLQALENKNIDTIYLAYSGGLDSSVLVHCISQLLCKDERAEGIGSAIDTAATLRMQAVALHVNHGLQIEADSWQQHCEQTCQLLGLDFNTVKLQLDEDQLKQKGVEAAARDARYKWFFEFMEAKNSALLTAHHQDDQAETVLLNLVRGSGVSGLAGMREQAEHGGSMLLRPFLNTPKENIWHYAQQHQLQWVEDPSNISAEFLRNRVRRELLPLIDSIRGGASKILVRVASNMRDVEGMLEELAESDLGGKVDCRQNPLDGSYCLSIDQVKNLSESRVVNVIRYWLKVLGLQSPARLTLLELARWCLGKDSEKLAHQLSDGWFYGYRGTLYYVPNGEQEWIETGVWSELSKPWVMRDGRQLTMRSQARSSLKTKDLEIVSLSRQDKCVCQDGSIRTLAKLLQDHRIPGWRRSNLWGVRSGSDVIWVAGIGRLLSAKDFHLEYQR